MEAWIASRKGIRIPTLSDKFCLDMETGEMVILVSNISESLSIRASSFGRGSCSVTEKTIGSMAMMKNSCEWVEDAWIWCTFELQFEGSGCANFQRSNDLKKRKIMTRVPLLYTLPDFKGGANRFGVHFFSPRNASGGATWSRVETTVFLSTNFQ